MFYPKLTEQRQQTLTTEAFLGYDHDLKLSDGEFYDMENLTSDCYPLLAPRVRRGTVQALSGAQPRGTGCAGCRIRFCISTARPWRRICRR